MKTDKPLIGNSTFSGRNDPLCRFLFVFCGGLGFFGGL